MPKAGLAEAKKAIAALKKSGKPIIITFHSLGDLDACASALSLAEFIGKSAIVAPPDRVNSESMRILKEEMEGLPKFVDACAKNPKAKIVLLDANDPALLSHLAGRKPDLIVDHHAQSDASVRAACEWIDPESPSASEMVAKIIGKCGPEFAQMLVFGILSDSARLARARPQTFAVLSTLLMHAGEDYEWFLSKLEKPEGMQSRAAVLEGLRNVTWQEKFGLVCAIAAVSSHEAHVAEVLVRAGADCAFAGTNSAKDCRISARMRPSLAARVDLPKLMEAVGKKIGGHGGGHMAAAGATGAWPGALDEALSFASGEFFRQAGAL